MNLSLISFARITVDEIDITDKPNCFGNKSRTPVLALKVLIVYASRLLLTG